MELLTSQYTAFTLTDETFRRQLTNKVFILAIFSESHIQSDDSSASELMIDFIIFQYQRKIYRSARFKESIIFIPTNYSTMRCARRIVSHHHIAHNLFLSESPARLLANHVRMTSIVTNIDCRKSTYNPICLTADSRPLLLQSRNYFLMLKTGTDT